MYLFPFFRLCRKKYINYKQPSSTSCIHFYFSCIVYSVPGHKPQRVGALEGLHLGLECQSGDQQVVVCVPAQPENMKKILPHKDWCNKGRPGEQPDPPHPECHQGVLQQISRLLHFSYMTDLKILKEKKRKERKERATAADLTRNP